MYVATTMNKIFHEALFVGFFYLSEKGNML